MVMLEDQTQPKLDKSKKNTAKKIPQRGLGVEKLEKLRIEEQQKNMSSPSSSSSSLQTMNFHKPETIYSFGGGLSMSNAEDLKRFSPLWLLNKKESLAIEPPSNQNYDIGNHSKHFSSQIDEKKTAGTSLVWPFHNAESMKFEYKDIGFSKERNLISNAHRVDWIHSEVHMNKRPRGNGSFLERDFLTLGLQYQGGFNNDVKQYEKSSEKALYSFLPTGEASGEGDGHEQREESLNDVDTRLKLSI